MLWCLCGSHNGLSYKVIVFTGAATGSEESGVGGLGARVVRALVEPLNGKGYHIYFNNYFSSVSLATEQASKGNYTIATTRPNWMGWPASLKDIKTLQKGMPYGDTRSGGGRTRKASLSSTALPIQTKPPLSFGGIKMVQGPL